MQCTIMTNGEYAALFRYRSIIDNSPLIICADGGANYAYQLEIIPYCIVGDMDSIRPEVVEHYTQLGVPFYKYPKRKDFTDTQLALGIAEEKGAEEITLLGSLGGRLDHTLSNLYGSMDFVQKGNRIIHYHPDYQVYIINRNLEIRGTPGDVVSVISLTDTSQGVTEVGFEYPLHEVILESNNPCFTVSNVMTDATATIQVHQGMLAVFHYPQFPDQ